MQYDEYFDYDESLIRLTNVEVLGKLPDPFKKENGERISSPAEWAEQRKLLTKTAVELQYGTQPPKPEVLEIETLHTSSKGSSYHITCGTREKTVTFLMRVIMPAGVENPAVVVDGDSCFFYPYNSKVTEPLLSRGIAYVTFNRTELAHDVRDEGRRQGALYGVYPAYTFGALGAWAWGYARCVDALEKIGGFDLSCLAFTGHSRGGKTAMLAGVLDERCAIVNPNDTNCSSCSCYRIHSSAIVENGEEKRSETLADLLRRFDFWIGEGMAEYADREADLPFDCHFLKALVAPRTLLLGEAASDAWTNLPGTYMTSLAATEVFRFLGCEENFLWYFRRGYHEHHPADTEMLALVIDHKKNGAPLPLDRFYRTPFPPPAPIFDWKAPDGK